MNGWVFLWGEFSAILINNGFLLFSSIVILPAFVLPVSPLLAFAGIWGETNGTLEATILRSIALSLNCVWTYWLARLCGLKVVTNFTFLEKENLMILKNSHSSFWELALILLDLPQEYHSSLQTISLALKCPSFLIFWYQYLSYQLLLWGIPLQQRNNKWKF